MAHSFEKGDSNRCRNAYERILHAELPMGALNVQKKNKVRPRLRTKYLPVVHLPHQKKWPKSFQKCHRPLSGAQLTLFPPNIPAAYQRRTVPHARDQLRRRAAAV